MDRPFWSWALGLCRRAAMWCILVKYSTRIPSALPSVVQSSVNVTNLWKPIQLSFPSNIWCWVLMHLSMAWHKIWEYINLSVRETDDFFIIDQRYLFPWRIFPAIWSHSKNLTSLFDYQLFRHVKHLFESEIVPCVFWWNVNFLSNSFPWIQMLPMSKT